MELLSIIIDNLFFPLYLFWWKGVGSGCRNQLAESNDMMVLDVLI